MNIINYINNTYKTHLKQYTYVKQEDCKHIKSSFSLKGINKSTLKLEQYGSVIEANTVYIRIYNLKTHQTSTLYAEHYYIFTKKNKVSTKNKLRKDLETFVKKINR
tara:strand:- start:102 stop:419 length:318 start_codon:yes stop_codon:yes gene_type:complete